jgi:hypothetical protein
MKIILKVGTAILLALAGVSVATDNIVRIEIKSSWDGLGNPSKGFLVIEQRGKRYVANGRSVDSNAVESLIAALQQPFVEQPRLEQCGITREWLLSNFRAALEDRAHEKLKSLSPKQVELFRNQFTDVNKAQVAFGELFKNWHTDDYPSVSVTAWLSNRKIQIESQSQYPFMLPWVGSDASGGYNCLISLAIGAVLPNNFSNRRRLLVSRGFRWDLADAVMRSIEPEWDLLETDFKVGRWVAPIVSRYTPVKSAISNRASIDLDGGQAWNAELRSPDLPANLIVGVSLRYDNRQLFGADEFLTTLPKYASLVQSVPWLSEYLVRHQDSTAELRYVNGRSLSAKAEESLITDLRMHDKLDLASRILQVSGFSAFVEINAGSGCWTRAVVLPSKEVLLWHFGRRCQSVLGFSLTDFKTWDYYGWRSTATLISPDGKLM